MAEPLGLALMDTGLFETVRQMARSLTVEKPGFGHG